MDEEKQSHGTPDSSSDSPETDLERNAEVEDFFHRLMERQDMKRPKPSPEAIAAALQAMQRLGAAVGEGDDPAASIDAPALNGVESGCPVAKKMVADPRQLGDDDPDVFAARS